MPKRPRQAHVPRQTARKRKARRGGVTVPADAYLDIASPVTVPGITREPAARIPIGGARASRAPAASARPAAIRLAGQLPTFERAYLVEELRRIAMTAGSLLILILVLALALR